MSRLEIRRNKVVILTEQALKDANPVKYMQGRFILKEIDRRINGIETQRINHLNQIQ